MRSMKTPVPAAIDPPRLTREEKQALTRERLIETAARLFAEQGYGATSLRDIAEQAGYSQGAFYSNFDSKESLLLEMLRRHMAAEAEQLAALTTDHRVYPAAHEDMTSARRSADEVLDSLEAWAATIDQRINWSMLSIELQLHAQRSPAFAVAYQAVWQTHRDALSAWIGRMFEDRGLRAPIAAQEIAAALMALAHGLSLQRVAAHSGVSSSVLVVFLRGLIAMAAPLETQAPKLQQEHPADQH